MKKIVIVRLDKACDPEVNSLEDVLEFMHAPYTDDAYECECEHKSKKKSDKSDISKELLDSISAIAKDLGIDVEQFKKDIIEEKHKADAKKAAEAAKAKTEAASKVNKSKPYTEYETGAIDGYEKGFKDAIKFISSRLNKSLTAALSDLNDMAKWNFKDCTLKEDAVFKK